MSEFKKRYRVDNVPFWIKPFYLIYSWTLGTFFYLYFALVHFTARFTFEGRENLKDDQNYFYAIWHHRVILAFVAKLRYQKHIWLNHPDWYMKPIHVSVWWSGVEKLILGSTGQGGREAADQLVNYLKQGYSSFMNPDGPYGPGQVLKKGILHLSEQGNVPIVPITIKANWYFRLGGWDQKIVPLPFSRITVRYAPPIFAQKEFFSEVANRVTKELNHFDEWVVPVRKPLRE